MIQKFVKAWSANKEHLEEHFKTHGMEEYNEYAKQDEKNISHFAGLFSLLALDTKTLLALFFKFSS